VVSVNCIVICADHSVSVSVGFLVLYAWVGVGWTCHRVT
jgi:hypothetical protein